jgi:hypothetical protein
MGFSGCKIKIITNDEFRMTDKRLTLLCCQVLPPDGLMHVAPPLAGQKYKTSAMQVQDFVVRGFQPRLGDPERVALRITSEEKL